MDASHIDAITDPRIDLLSCKNPVGTIVIQYFDDNHTVIGMIVDPVWIANAQNTDQFSAEYLQVSATRDSFPRTHQVMLVLAERKQFDDSIFSDRQAVFPYYLVGQVEVAEVYDFSSEIKCIRTLQDELKLLPRFTGLNWGSRRHHFFSTQLSEEMLIVEYVSYYVKNHLPIEIQNNRGLVSTYTDKLLAELQKHFS